MRGEELILIVPYKDGKANHGHSCVKGRFASGIKIDDRDTHINRLKTWPQPTINRNAAKNP